MKTAVTTVLLLASVAVSVNAFSLNFFGTFGNGQFQNAEGEPTNGVTVRVITFQGSGFSPVAGEVGLQDISDNATVLAEAETVTDFSGTVGSVAIDEGGFDGFEGAALYVFAQLGGGEYGLWRDATVDSEWVGGPDGSDNLEVVSLDPLGPLTAFAGTLPEVGIFRLGEVPDPVTVEITAVDASAAEFGLKTGTFRVSRAGDLDGDLTVNLGLAASSPQGTVEQGADFTLSAGGEGTVLIPDGAESVDITLTPVADDEAEGEQVVTVTVLPGVYLAGESTSAEVAISDQPLHAWRVLHFGNNANVSAQAGEGADPDGDGVVNLFEYAFEADPTTPQAVEGGGARPIVTFIDGHVQIQFRVPKAAPDLAFRIESSADLAIWTAGAAYSLQDAILARTPGTGTEPAEVEEKADYFLVSERFGEPPASGEAVFLRLVVLRPE